MPDLVYTPDHRARALSDLVSAYRGRPRIEALVEALAGGAEAAEDETFGLLLSHTLTAAQGALLDQWGALVGEARQGLDDEDYRRFIRARLLANRSQGTVPELVAVFSIITEPGAVRYHDHFPAGFRLTVYRPSPMSAQLRGRVRRMMYAIKPAGVGMTLAEGSLDALQLSEANRGLGSPLSRTF